MIWGILAIVTAIVLGSTAFGSFRMDWPTFVLPALACAFLIPGSHFYQHWRKDPKLASALAGTAHMALFIAAGAPLSYIAASADFPLFDRVFLDMDRALNFDWRGTLAWMNLHPALHLAFAFAYESFKLQAITAVVVLAFSGHLLQLRQFTLAFFFSALICIGVSALYPAEGVWGYLHLTQADYPAIIPVAQETHLPIFHGLRDGTFRALTAMTAEGIITFPSFHAALAVIFAVALWPVPILLRWIGLALNILMIASTPIDGGHYFIDVIAGIAIGTFCVIAVRSSFLGRGGPPRIRLAKPRKSPSATSNHNF